MFDQTPEAVREFSPLERESDRVKFKEFNSQGVCPPSEPWCKQLIGT